MSEARLTVRTARVGGNAYPARGEGRPCVVAGMQASPQRHEVVKAPLVAPGDR